MIRMKLQPYTEELAAIQAVLYPYINKKRAWSSFLPKLKTKLIKIYRQVDCMNDNILEIRIMESQLLLARKAWEKINEKS